MTVAVVLHRADGASTSTHFQRAAFGTSDPFALDREIAWEGPDSISAGRISFEGALEVKRYPHIETLIVVEGELILTAAGAASLVLTPGIGAVIGQGTELRIQAASRVRLLFCAATSETATPGLAPLRADADFIPSASLPPAVLLGPPPECRDANVFADDSAQYTAGTWDSTPYERIVRPHRINEFMYLLAGSVRFAAPDGSVLELGTGEALFVPKGASIGWESSERVAKFYVSQDVQD